MIPEKTVRRMLDVLEHIEEYIEKAYDWIRTLDRKDGITHHARAEKRLPHQFQGRFLISGINFGDVLSTYDHFSFLIWSQYRCGKHHPKYASDSFSIDIECDYCIFLIKFDYKDMLPYEIEIRDIYC